MEYKLKEEVINKLLNYLGSRPYIEVAGLIHDLQTATPVKEIVVEETEA